MPLNGMRDGLGAAATAAAGLLLAAWLVLGPGSTVRKPGTTVGLRKIEIVDGVERGLVAVHEQRRPLDAAATAPVRPSVVVMTERQVAAYLGNPPGLSYPSMRATSANQAIVCGRVASPTGGQRRFVSYYDTGIAIVDNSSAAFEALHGRDCG